MNKNEIKTYTVWIGCFNVTVQARTQKEANRKAERKVDAMLNRVGRRPAKI